MICFVIRKTKSQEQKYYGSFDQAWERMMELALLTMFYGQVASNSVAWPAAEW